MNERLSQFLAAENISNSKFADVIGVARASISHILAGRNKPGYDFICSIMENYPSLNVEWLLLGKGRMYKTSAVEKTPSLQISERVEEQRKEDFETDLFSAAEVEKETTNTEGTSKIQNSIPTTAPVQNSVSSETFTSGENKGITTTSQRRISKVLVLFSNNTFHELGD